MLAEVSEVAFDKLRGGGGDEHLPAMTGGRDTGSAVNIVADVALVGEER